MLYRRMEELTIAAGQQGKQNASLIQEKQELKDKLANLAHSFSAAQDVIAGLETDLTKYGNALDPKIREEAEMALMSGDFEAAERAYAKICDHGEMEIKRTAEAWYQRGEVAALQIRWDDAAAHYSRAATLAPNYDSLSAAQDFQRRTRNFEAADRLGVELLSFASAEFGDQHKMFAPALGFHARTLELMERYDEAEKCYQQAIEIDEVTIRADHPDHTIHLNGYALLLMKMEREGEAGGLLREAERILYFAVGTADPRWKSAAWKLECYEQEQYEKWKTK